MEFTLREFIPTERKLDLIGLTIQESIVDGIINPMLQDILFKVNTVLIYTDNDITMEEKEDKLALYDKFVKESVWEVFESQMDEKYPDEIYYLTDSLYLWTTEQKVYMHSNLALMEILKDYLTGLVNALVTGTDLLKDIDWTTMAQINSLAESLGFNLPPLQQAEDAEEIVS